MTERIRPGTPYLLSAVSDSGLPVLYEMASGPGVIDGSRLLITNPGPVRVVAKQVGSSAYEPATYTRTFNRAEVEVERLAAWPAYSRGSAVKVCWLGDFACVAAGTLQIFDIRFPSAPTLVYALEEFSSISALTLSGSLAVVANASSTLAVLDLSDPANPVEVSKDTSLQHRGVSDLAIHGDYLYAAGEDGLEILKATSPTHYTSIGIVATTTRVSSIQVVDGRAYLAVGSKGVMVLDMTSPGNPIVLSSLETGGDAREVFVSGGFAYIANGNAGFKIMDFRDLTKPVLIGTYDTLGTAVGVKVLEDRVYVADSNGGILVLDVSSPGSPQRKASLSTLGTAVDLDVRGNLILAALDREGLGIGKLESTSSLEWKAIQPTSGDAKSVSLANGYAYVLDSFSRIQVIDVRDPTRPQWVSEHKTVEGPNVMKWEGTTAYIGSRILEITDFSDPSLPRSLGQHLPSGGIVDLDVRDGLAYLATRTNGIMVVDVANPRSPKPLATLPYPNPRSSVQSLAILGGHAYVADFRSILIADVGEWRQPRWVGTTSLGYFISGLDALGSELYAIRESWGVGIYDLSNPSNPTFLSQTGGFSTKAGFVEAGVLGVVDQKGGISIYDAMLPRAPYLLGRFQSEPNAVGIAMDNDLVCVAKGVSGIELFRIRSGLRQTLVLDAPSSAWVGDSIEILPASSSGLPVNIQVAQGSATWDGQRLNCSVAGHVVLRASQPGNAEYLPVTVEHHLEVRLPSQTVIWSLPNSGTLNILEAYDSWVRTDSGLPAELLVRSGPVVREGDHLSVSNLNPAVLVARQSGNSNHAPLEALRSFNEVEVRVGSERFWPTSAHARIHSVAAARERLYLACGPAGLVVWETHDSLIPRPILSVDYGSRPMFGQLIQVAQDRGYLVDRDGTLHLFDLTNPDRPEKAGSLALGSAFALPEDLAVDGQYVYVVSAIQGFITVDASDLLNPKVVAMVAATGSRGLVVEDGFAWVTRGYDGLSTYDVRDRLRPILLSAQGLSGNAVAVARRESLIAVAMAYDGCVLLDASDPGAPRQLTHVPSLKGEEIAFHGERLIMADSSAFRSVDLSDAKNPVVSILPLEFSSPYLSLVSAEGGAYLCDGISGVAKIDLRQPSKPLLIHRISIQTNYLDVLVSGSTAFAVHSRGLEILDVSRTNETTMLSSVAFDGQGSCLTRLGDTVFLGTGAGTVVAINVADAKTPMIQQTISVKAPVYDIDSDGDRLVVATGRTGWRVFDTSRIGDLRPIGTSPPGFEALSVVLDGNRLCALSMDRRLQVLDLEQPDAPRELVTLPFESYSGDLCVVDDFAYLVLGDGTLRVVDIRDPAIPEILGTLHIEEGLSAIRVAHGVAYVGSIRGQLSMIDVRDPRSPIRVGTVPLRSEAWSLSVDEGRIGVAGGEGGLLIAELEVRHPQSITSALPSRVASPHGLLALEATASSGLPLTWRVLSGPAILSADGIQFTGLGTVRVEIEQQGNSHFRPASSVRTISVEDASVSTILRNWFERMYPDVAVEARDLLSDPDSDGVPNLLECLLNTHPARRDANDGRIPWGEVDAGSGVWRIRLPFNRELADAVSWGLEWTESLSGSVWQRVPDTSIQQTDDAIIVGLPDLGMTRFLRLRIRLE